MLNRPGDFSSSHSIIVVALSLPAASPWSRGRISSSQTPSKGSGRVRHRRSVSEGNGPHCHFRADRSSPPWPPPSVVSFLPSVASNATCCRNHRHLLYRMPSGRATGKTNCRQASGQLTVRADSGLRGIRGKLGLRFSISPPAQKPAQWAIPEDAGRPSHNGLWPRLPTGLSQKSKTITTFGCQ